MGRPAETVSPEVSECSRIPDSRRPAASATSPCAPSCAIVTTWRVDRQSVGERTRSAATAAVPSRTSVRSSGTVAVTSPRTGRGHPRPAVNRTEPGNTRQGASVTRASSPASARTRAGDPSGSTSSRTRPPAAACPLHGLDEQADAGAGEIAEPAEVQVERPGRRGLHRRQQLRTHRLGRGEVQLPGQPEHAVVGADEPGTRLGAVQRRPPPDRRALVVGRQHGHAEAHGRAPGGGRLHADLLGQLVDQPEASAAEAGIGRHGAPPCRSPPRSTSTPPSGSQLNAYTHSPAGRSR